MNQIKIDGRTYEVEEGQNLLHAGLSLGLDIPYFCWHPAMGSVGACRLCAVKQFKDEHDSEGKIVMSCMTPIEDGLIVSLEDPEVLEFRRSVTEWLMVNHPHDCPICDEGGECHLQDMTLMTGHCYREFRFRKRTHRNQYLGPFINHEMNRCIQCYRCVRFYSDLAGGSDLQAFGAHDHVYFGRQTDGVLEREFSGNLVEICPTGVFTDKTLKGHYTRKWDLQTAPSICVHCSAGCNTIPGERYGTLRRIRNRFNSEVNGYFLCDRGRFGYEFVNAPTRLRQPRLKSGSQEKPQETGSDQVRSRLSDILKNESALLGIGSPRASVEANFLLRKLVGSDNFSPGFSVQEQLLVSECLHILQRGPAKAASIGNLEKADAVLVLGEDLTNTAPRLDLALHSAVRRQPIDEIASARNVPEWHDAAVRQAIQQATGPLFVATPSETKLDHLATRRFRGSPSDIARLGFAVAAALGSGVAVGRIDPELEQLASQIAKALEEAHHPVVIGGVSLGSVPILHAAANVANALDKPERRAGISLVVPECNSVGSAMLGGPSCEHILDLCRRDGSTLIVLENDLFRRCDASNVTKSLGEAGHVILIDHTETETTALAETVLPAATFAESTGTLVNFEGRAQRFYQVLEPEADIPDSWRLIQRLHGLRNPNEAEWETIQEVDEAIESEIPAFRGIATLAPPPNFRIVGQRIPRQSHRYSGRTAMHAEENIHEPRPASDPDSPLSFSMEGYSGQPPSDLIREYWAPGWNSVQSLNKFQDEVGGPLSGRVVGLRLIEAKSDQPFDPFEDVPEPFKQESESWLAVPVHHIFGSEPMSSLAPAVSELVAEPYIAISSQDASELGFSDGFMLRVQVEKEQLHLPARIDSQLPRGMVGLPLLHEIWLCRPTWVKVESLEDH